MAAAALVLAGEDPARVGDAVLADPHVPGRMERVVVDGRRRTCRCAVVDYAHTPDAVGAALRGAAPHDHRPPRLRPRRRRRPRPRQAPRDGAPPRPRSPTSSSSPTTTRARRTRRPSAPPSSRGSSPCGATGRAVAVRSRATAGRDPRGRRGRRAPRAPPPPSPSSARGTRPGQDVGGVVHPFDDRDELRAALAPRRRGGWRRDPDDPRGRGRWSPAGASPASPRPRPTPCVVDGPVVTDSREAGPGGLYVARVGERVDGHDFAGAAVEARVRGRPDDPGRSTDCPASSSTTPRRPSPPSRAPCVERAPRPRRRRHHRLLGQDEHQGPARRGARDRGPDGRARRLLQLRGRRAAHGVPGHAPTPASSSSRWAPAASGTSRYLARMAPPRIGVVLNVGHRARRRVRLARGDRPRQVRARRGAARGRRSPSSTPTTPPCARWPRSPPPASSSSARPTTPTSGPPTSSLDASGRPTFTLTTAGRRGRGVRSASSAATTSATPWPSPPWRSSSGSPSRASPPRSSAARPVSRWRMEVTERPDGVTVVNDAYNANPDSMRAALSALERLGEGRRTWAVLGTMLELGDESAALHAEVGAEAVRRGVDELRRRRRGRPAARRRGGGGLDGPGATRVRSVAGRRRGGGAPARGAPARRRGPVQVQPGRGATVARRPTRHDHRGAPDVKAVLIAAVVSLVLALFGTPGFLRFLVKRGYGQFIRDDGPTSHHTKRGTPTMGGAVIVLSSLVAYVVAHLVTLQRSVGERPARPLPHGRDGHRRLPRRLHQDQQAAQPRAPVAGEARGADARGRHLRRPRAAVPQRTRSGPPARPSSRSSATPRSTSPSRAR